MVTVGRSDYGIYLPLLKAILADPDLQLQLIVAGMHLAPEFGQTVNAIEAEGIPIGERVELLLASDSPTGIAKSMGLGVMGYADVFGRRPPDILVVLGDRFEMYAAALAALPFRIPVAHIHGGEVTQGAFDDALRHSMTKLSHLHFVSTEAYAQRVRQLGEEPWRVVVSGAPSLDNLRTQSIASAAELEARFGFKLEPKPLLVTFHPVTLEYESVEVQTQALLKALEATGQPVIFTRPNADTNNHVIVELLETYIQAHTNAWLVDNLGTRNYFGIMQLALAMVGNSSSGLIEAASFELPVVNIGNRQAGRVRGLNVIDVAEDWEAIKAGIEKAADPAFKQSLRGMRNPYVAESMATSVILEKLKSVPLDSHLIVKHFYDLPTV